MFQERNDCMKGVIPIKHIALMTTTTNGESTQLVILLNTFNVIN